MKLLISLLWDIVYMLISFGVDEALLSISIYFIGNYADANYVASYGFATSV